MSVGHARVGRVCVVDAGLKSAGALPYFSNCCWCGPGAGKNYQPAQDSRDAQTSS